MSIRQSSFLARFGFCLSLISVLMLSACNYKKDKTSEEPVVELDPNTAIGFAEVKAQVFDLSCNSCHSVAGGNQGGLNLENYASTFAKRTAIKRDSVDSSRMPPNGSLSANAKAVLKKWLEKGAPETK